MSEYIDVRGRFTIKLTKLKFQGPLLHWPLSRACMDTPGKYPREHRFLEWAPNRQLIRSHVIKCAKVRWQ